MLRLSRFAFAPSHASPPVSDAELTAFRRVCVVAVLGTVVFGYVHRAAYPGAWDPVWQRVVLIAGVFGVLLLTYVLRGRPLLFTIYAPYYAYTAWVLELLAMNRLYPDYAVATMVVVGVISVGFMRHTHLRTYLLSTLAAVLAIVLLVPRSPSLRINGLLYASYLGLFCVITYIMMRGRLTVEEQLAASNQRYALAARGANDGLWDWDLARGRVHFSPRWREMLGLGDDDPARTLDDWLARVHPEDAARVEAELRRHLDGGSAHFESEFRVRHADGTWRWMLARGLAVRGAEGQPVRMAGSQTDVTVRRVAEEQLVHSALHDALTGLPNRALFLDRAGQLLAQRLRRPRDGMAVMLLDVDRFKVINDSLGHAAGDELIAAVGRRLRSAVPAEDTVARLGGDEFAVLLGAWPGDEGAARLAAAILAEVAAPLSLAGREVVATASLGIAHGPDGCEDADDLLRNAGLAMLRAKALGPGRCAVFGDGTGRPGLERLELETELRGAVDRGEMRLHYQPIVSLDERQVTGFEALVRWQHPRRGLLPPAQFVPLAEETGLIHALGGWVLREACRQAGAWGGAEAVAVSVNVSARQLARRDFVDEVAAALEDAGVEPARLRLEITESTLLADPESALEVVSALRGLGVRVQLDDFGTGYSSFSYLHRFPIDGVKIDRSFVTGLDREPRNAAIVRTLVVLAHTLGVSVVAEGVENAAEALQLQAFRCGSGQGFFFSTPLDADEASRLLEMAEPLGTPVGLSA